MWTLQELVCACRTRCEADAHSLQPGRTTDSWPVSRTERVQYAIPAQPVRLGANEEKTYETPSQSDPPYPPISILLRQGGDPESKRTQVAGHPTDRGCPAPRGYRELRSNGEMRKPFDTNIVAQGGKCAICVATFTDYSDIVPDHISPRGMGGAWRDDHPENIPAVHWWCNGEKGSKRI